MKNKETLFSKNNYDIQLEEILEHKAFDDEAKSLILNILYKIEIGYKDYSKIKYGARLKSKIIEDILDTIKNECDNIEIINPKNSKSKISVDKKEKKIKVFPSEIFLLQALYYIRTKDAKQGNIFEKTIRIALNKGFSINGVEIIRDFNGWSWNSDIESQKSKYYNLIYQNLLILLGNAALTNLLKKDNIRENLINSLEEIYGEKKANELVDTIEQICILIYMYNNPKKEEEVFSSLAQKQKELKEMENKSEYISKITVQNNENMESIIKIEEILKNRNLITKKFSKKTVINKYKTIENYKNHLERVRANKLKLITENTNLINPFEYVKRKKQLEREIKILNNMKILSKKSNPIYTNLIDLQRKVISCFYKKIEVYDLKKELINLVYEIRYYNLLPIEKDKKIKDLKELEVDLRNMQKKIISKLCENKVIETFSEDYNINYTILKYIFIAKMTNINKILVKLKYKDKKLYIEYYDENVLESEMSINFSDDDFNELTKKIDKKIRIFI